MQRLIVCCDGTWNTAFQTTPSNVVKLHDMIAEQDSSGIRQVSHYVEGVGTRPWDRLLGGIFGLGLSANVQEGFRFLVRHFEPGDQLYLLGFSRGAYTARSLAGLVRNSGVLHREHEGRLDEAYQLYRDSDAHPDGAASVRFRASYSHETRISVVGVWDTVGSLGIPAGAVGGPGLARWLNRRWQFHDTSLSSRVDAAFHAVAIDERRRSFSPTLWDPSRSEPDRPTSQRVAQVWFSGVHSDVGGGYPETGLSDLALLWMADRLRECGLALTKGDPSDVTPRPDPEAQIHDSRRHIFSLVPPVSRELGAVAPDVEYAASSAAQRQDHEPAYAPNLRAYRDLADAQIWPVDPW